MTNSKSNPGFCVFTIVSKNYLHFARTLMASVRANAPADTHLVVCLCDRPEGLDLSGEIFDVIQIEELPIPEISKFIFQYTMLELNTAVKPFVIATLFDRGGYDKVIYFDPDIRIYSSLREMFELLDQYNVLLTPHLTDWLDDGHHPNELAILQSGTYNLGYVGLKRSEETQKMVTWWQSKLLRDCIVDIPRGLFVDQKWLDMVPGMYEGVHIHRHPGWNVAYWNIKHRKVERAPSGYCVNGRPLVFFHYSGISVNGKTFSKHQDRFTMGNLQRVVQELVKSYVHELVENGGKETSLLGYAFGRFPDGTVIPDIARNIYREVRDELDDRMEDMLGLAGTQAFKQYLNGPAVVAGRSSSLVTRLMYKLYSIRPDIQYAFPDVFGVHSLDYAHWFVANAADQAQMPETFTEPVYEALEKMKVKKYVSATGREGLVRRLCRLALSRLYRVAWNFRGVARRFVKYETRHRLHAWLIRQAFETRGSIDTEIKASPRPSNEWVKGLNVVGYLQAESGVGESARSTLRAAKACGIKVSAIDFRAGNVSRMEEKIAENFGCQQEFGINLFHINADQMPIARNELGYGFFEEHYNIGYWAWELPELPDEWQGSLELLDEVWVPSNFCQKAISQKSHVPVLRIPHCINLSVPEEIGRRELGLPEEGFLFCSIMDVLSVPERKNPIALLEAYRQAFGSRPRNIYFVLKIINVNNRPEIMRVIQGYMENDPSIIMMDQYLSRPDLNALLNAIDCYVSLHRSEGFGLCLAEAMSLGKPVIATGWSGNMDFMDQWNSFSVRYSLGAIQEDLGPYKKGQIWADPDLEHAAEHMQLVARDRNIARQIGDRAKEHMCREYSPMGVGRLIAERIALIARGFAEQA